MGKRAISPGVFLLLALSLFYLRRARGAGRFFDELTAGWDTKKRNVRIYNNKKFTDTVTYLPPSLPMFAMSLK
jgi:hypothetical protein